MLATGMRVNRIVEQLITGMRVIPLMGGKNMLATGMRVNRIVEQLITGMRVTLLMGNNYCYLLECESQA